MASDERAALVSTFRLHWRPGTAPGTPLPELPPELEVALQQAVLRGSRAWPRVKLAAPDFIAHLARHAPEEAAELVSSFDALHVEDLYLACACLARDRAALDELEQRHLSRLTLRRMPALGSQIDEVRERLRERLLMETAESRPRLERYSGQGPLAAWLQVVAARLALNLIRDGQREASSEDEAVASAAVLVAEDDPEIEYVKRRYQEDLAASFREAMQALDRRERYLLRLHLCDRLGVDRIAALEGVHRATAARWLAAARERLHDDTLRRLQHRLGTSPADLKSLVRLLRSQLDVSVSRYLGEEPQQTGD